MRAPRGGTSAPLDPSHSEAKRNAPPICPPPSCTEQSRTSSITCHPGRVIYPLHLHLRAAPAGGWRRVDACMHACARGPGWLLRWPVCMMHALSAGRRSSLSIYCTADVRNQRLCAAASKCDLAAAECAGRRAHRSAKGTPAGRRAARAAGDATRTNEDGMERSVWRRALAGGWCYCYSDQSIITWGDP
ncbi:hypothetical protein GUJ93_ZPchr0013g36309 [Zizania palustris]|uniref:Uncharacterized protein n=1 Tax=Zizania palustris TaxID=103762 RepID=A0A8J5X4K0_ZIZPA|nr:hypothetical protein GUJ93_ZPchr0013g36309 [Zizania palustris]